MVEPVVLTAFDPLPSPLARDEPRRPPLRVGVVQEAWRADPAAHEAALAAGIRQAAALGASVVCLQELTLSRYFADEPDGAAAQMSETIPDGPTTRFAARLAAERGVWVQASLYERAEDGGLGYNTAICVAPSGEVVARTRKLHIPAFVGYHEDRYFRPGAPAYPVVRLGGAGFGFPTCWDQWFPELARAYALAGAEVIVYPTAIGTEPNHGGFDSQPVWEQVIAANGAMNATFMIAVNRIGDEGRVQFYGSSFISDPYGRVLLRAPRDRAAVLVADLDLDQRRDWLRWGMFATRRPDAYAPLLATAAGG
ncbi:MAG: hydrolase [Thermomicrobiales bacterium]|nr:hydrolase [Thermomicrobiales bacterium]